MKVLILGGTGAMGVHLVQILSDNDVETVVTTRGNKKSKGNVKYLQGNAYNKDFLQTILLQHWDAIVDFMVYSTSDFKDRVNLLLDATPQYIFLSSARVYANSDKPITESSPLLLDVSEDTEYLATDEYALSKARQENVLRNSSYKNWTIIRPYITYSENRLQLGVLEKEEWLYRAIKGRTIVFSKEISSKITTLTYGLDVANGIFATIGNSSAYGETFHITAINSKTWSEILNIYLEILQNQLGYKPKVLLQNLDKFFNYHPAKYQIFYDRLFERKFDNSKIGQFVNTNGFIRAEEGLRSCLNNFIQNPLFNKIDWKSEALKDRQTKEHTSLYEIHGFKQKIKYLIFRFIPLNINS